MTPLEALQATLAAEHSAVWLHATLGAQTSQSGQPTLWSDIQQSYALHRARRDHLTLVIRDLAADPVASSVSYALPNDASTPALVTAAALEVERGCAATYAELVGSTSGDQRAWAVQALTDAAVRELRFRGSPETFPGIDEFTDR